MRREISFCLFGSLSDAFRRPEVGNWKLKVVKWEVGRESHDYSFLRLEGNMKFLSIKSINFSYLLHRIFLLESVPIIDYSGQSKIRSVQICWQNWRARDLEVFSKRGTRKSGHRCWGKKSSKSTHKSRSNWKNSLKLQNQKI